MKAARFVLVAALVAFISPDALAQDQSKVERKPLPQDEWIQTVARRLAAQRRDEQPTETARAGKQVTAPSGAAAGGTVVDAPSFVQVIGLAVDNNLLAFKDGALTTDLNLFAFKVLADPSVLVTQEEYGKYVTMRRFGGSLTLGGKGEEFDQNGDGTKDKAKETENITDIVRAELRWRFSGTRDRRDARSVANYISALAEIDKKLTTALFQLAPMLIEVIRVHDKSAQVEDRILEPCKVGSPDECVFSDKVEALTKLAEGALGSQFGAFGELLEAYDKTHATAIKAIDRQAIWTAVVNGTHQAADFGPERFGLGIRGLFAVGAWDHTLNVDWTRANWRAGRPIAHSGKVGYSFSRLLSSDPDAELVPKVTLAFSGEAFRDVPDAKHDAILTAGLRVDIPFSASVSLPISLTYASHADLLTDQKLVRGNIGLAWDFSGLSKKKPQ